MTDVEDFLDRQPDAEERLACYKQFTEAFVRNLKKSEHQTAMDFLQINYSVFAGMMNMASDFKTQEFFDRVVTTEYILDGGRMQDRASLHAELKAKLDLPDWYGGNLDALNDCLGERAEKALVVLERFSDFAESQDEYGLRLLQVFSDNGLLGETRFTLD